VPRRAPTIDTLRALFAKSANRCAFPGCDHELIADSNLFVAQVCHIEAAEPGGERYNAAMTDEARRSFENLLLLCYCHYVETDRVDLYSVVKMKQLKADHERAAARFVVDEVQLARLAQDMDAYWARIDHVQATINVQRASGHVFEIPPKIDRHRATLDLWKDTFERLEHVRSLFQHVGAAAQTLPADLVAYYTAVGVDLSPANSTERPRNPADGFCWETLNLGAHNVPLDLELTLRQLEIRHLENILARTPGDADASRRLEVTKTAFECLVREASYAD